MSGSDDDIPDLVEAVQATTLSDKPTETSVRQALMACLSANSLERKDAEQYLQQVSNASNDADRLIYLNFLLSAVNDEEPSLKMMASILLKNAAASNTSTLKPAWASLSPDHDMDFTAKVVKVICEGVHKTQMKALARGVALRIIANAQSSPDLSNEILSAITAALGLGEEDSKQITDMETIVIPNLTILVSVFDVCPTMHKNLIEKISIDVLALAKYAMSLWNTGGFLSAGRELITELLATPVFMECLLCALDGDQVEDREIVEGIVMMCLNVAVGDSDLVEDDGCGLSELQRNCAGCLNSIFRAAKTLSEQQPDNAGVEFLYSLEEKVIGTLLVYAGEHASEGPEHVFDIADLVDSLLQDEFIVADETSDKDDDEDEEGDDDIPTDSDEDEEEEEEKLTEIEIRRAKIIAGDAKLLDALLKLLSPHEDDERTDEEEQAENSADKAANVLLRVLRAAPAKAAGPVCQFVVESITSNPSAACLALSCVYDAHVYVAISESKAARTKAAALIDPSVAPQIFDQLLELSFSKDDSSNTTWQLHENSRFALSKLISNEQMVAGALLAVPKAEAMKRVNRVLESTIALKESRHDALQLPLSTLSLLYNLFELVELAQKSDEDEEEEDEEKEETPEVQLAKIVVNSAMPLRTKLIEALSHNMWSSPAKVAERCELLALILSSCYDEWDTAGNAEDKVLMKIKEDVYKRLPLAVPPEFQEDDLEDDEEAQAANVGKWVVAGALLNIVPLPKDDIEQHVETLSTMDAVTDDAVIFAGQLMQAAKKQKFTQYTTVGESGKKDQIVIGFDSEKLCQEFFARGMKQIVKNAPHNSRFAELNDLTPGVLFGGVTDLLQSFASECKPLVLVEALMELLEAQEKNQTLSHDDVASGLSTLGDAALELGDDFASLLTRALQVCAMTLCRINEEEDVDPEDLFNVWSNCCNLFSGVLNSNSTKVKAAIPADGLGDMLNFAKAVIFSKGVESDIMAQVVMVVFDCCNYLVQYKNAKVTITEKERNVIIAAIKNDKKLLLKFQTMSTKKKEKMLADASKQVLQVIQHL